MQGVEPRYHISPQSYQQGINCDDAQNREWSPFGHSKSFTPSPPPGIEIVSPPEVRGHRRPVVAHDEDDFEFDSLNVEISAASARMMDEMNGQQREGNAGAPHLVAPMSLDRGPFTAPSLGNGTPCTGMEFGFPGMQPAANVELFWGQSTNDTSWDAVSGDDEELPQWADAVPGQSKWTTDGSMQNKETKPEDLETRVRRAEQEASTQRAKMVCVLVQTLRQCCWLLV